MHLFLELHSHRLKPLVNFLKSPGYRFACHCLVKGNSLSLKRSLLYGISLCLFGLSHSCRSFKRINRCVVEGKPCHFYVFICISKAFLNSEQSILLLLLLNFVLKCLKVPCRSLDNDFLGCKERLFCLLKLLFESLVKQSLNSVLQGSGCYVELSLKEGKLFVKLLNCP